MGGAGIDGTPMACPRTPPFSAGGPSRPPPLAEPRLHPVEELAPARLRRLVARGRQAAARLRHPHLGAAVLELDQDDRDAVAEAVGAGLVGDGEDQQLGRLDLEVVALPVDLPALRAR